MYVKYVTSLVIESILIESVQSLNDISTLLTFVNIMI